MTSDVDALVTVRILELPVALHERAQAHSDELTREFRLLAEQMREEGTEHIPRRLVELVDTLNDTYSVFTEEQQDVLDKALATRRAAVDLTYQLPAHAAQAAAALAELLEEADAFCAAGEHLLTLSTPADCVAYRRWFLDEFIQQTAGRAPTPWPASPYAEGLEA